MHPFRFGIQQAAAASGRNWAEVGRRAESIGYDVLVMPDHLNRQLSPLTALAVAAAATTRLRLCAFVFANDYRHPLILAREAATLHFLSGGRFEMGLGAGWMTGDYRRLGMPYDPPGRRVDRLQESIPLVKRLLAGDVVTHHGRHYDLEEASAGVPAAGLPPPRLAVGAGLPRMLRLAAREADIVGLTPGFSRRGLPIVREATETALARKVATVREAAGARFEGLELSVWLGDAGMAGSGNTALASMAASLKWAATMPYGSPFVLYGTLGSMRDRLLRRRERLGISYYTIPGRAMESMGPLVEALAGR